MVFCLEVYLLVHLVVYLMVHFVVYMVMIWLLFYYYLLLFIFYYLLFIYMVFIWLLGYFIIIYWSCIIIHILFIIWGMDIEKVRNSIFPPKSLSLSPNPSVSHKTISPHRQNDFISFCLISVSFSMWWNDFFWTKIISLSSSSSEQKSFSPASFLIWV